MTERLLQFIWQFQYFNRYDLRTEEGALLQIQQPGKHNTNQGPDFLEAAIKVAGTLLVGNIELHTHAADWNKHGHDGDPNYKNVILHVVWKRGPEKELPFVPMLVLENRISNLLLQRYANWLEQASFVPCGPLAGEAPALVWLAWKERLLLERMIRKNGYILALLSLNKHHWEETCWQLLAKNFGVRLNADAFENIARSLPLALLARHKNQLTVLEALLLGQAGLLEPVFTDAYALLLQREYRFLRHKYKLIQPAGNVFFLRMRPAAFPTVRLAQLAVLVHRSVHLFAAIRESAGRKEVAALLNVTANDYWHYHYRLGEPAAYQEKTLGGSMINNIIINTVAPVLFAYGSFYKEQGLQNKALQWLTETVAEKNGVTAAWKGMGVASKDACESQALIELKTQYCDKKRCLECAIGNSLLKRNATYG